MKNIIMPRLNQWFRRNFSRVAFLGLILLAGVFGGGNAAKADTIYMWYTGFGHAHEVSITVNVNLNQSQY